ncbi:MAG TPA: (Fe-S)-binding protein [Firmicutes bacterium]|nr:(Fe-S)-binding protein [Bacillales bacterium]HJA40743.1 (Fe-S)-binding protein [Bacillota bacterium]
MKVHLFTQCIVDMFYPNVGIAAVEVLEKLGCEVMLPETQVCCGQPLSNSGYIKDAKKSFKNMIRAFEDAEIVVSLSGSCAYALTEYPHLLDDEPEWKNRAEALTKKTYEFTDFLVNVLKVENIGAKFPKKVTFHKSCHATRLLGIREQPLRLLNHVEGLEYIELKEAERCCGFGGTFSVKMGDISALMVDEKAQTVIDSGADVLTGVDCACLFNIEGRLKRLKDEGKLNRDIEVLHIAEILNQTCS